MFTRFSEFFTFFLFCCTSFIENSKKYMILHTSSSNESTGINIRAVFCLIFLFFVLMLFKMKTNYVFFLSIIEGFKFRNECEDFILQVSKIYDTSFKTALRSVIKFYAIQVLFQTYRCTNVFISNKKKFSFLTKGCAIGKLKN